MGESWENHRGIRRNWWNTANLVTNTHNKRYYDMVWLQYAYSMSDNETAPISLVLIGQHLIFWHHHHAATCLKNVCQSSIRRGKKLDSQLSHKHPLWFEAVEGPEKRINLFKWTGYTWINRSIFRVTEPYLELSLKINKRLRLKIANDPKIE